MKNVIQSMWKLNEKSSSQLMSYFFDHLAAGNSSSVALTKAKRQYLENPEISDRLKHPYYWAGIGHYGYGAVLAEKSESLNWIFILMGATFLIIVLTTVMIKLNKW